VLPWKIRFPIEERNGQNRVIRMNSGMPPEQGREFFTRCGWKAQEVHSTIHAAARLNRLSFFLRLIAKISSSRFQPRRPWSAVCLLTKQ
jgi:hypothetical protein